MVAARKILQGLPRADYGEDTEVSPADRTAILNMKAALAAFVTARAQCASTGVTENNLKEELSTAGHVDAFDDAPPQVRFNYGGQESFSVKRWPEHPTLLGVTATFQIECGDDSMLMIFDSSSGSWHEVLRWQSATYSEISGAFGGFHYALSPPDSRANWYVLVTNIRPWCTSLWNTIRYSVLRPGVDALAPRVIFARDEGIYLDGEDELTANTADFELRFLNDSIDIRIHNRTWIERYSIHGDEVRRIQPVALSPRDFADAWIQEDWEQASGWTAPGIRNSVRALHATLRTIRTFEYYSVRRCADRARHFEVAVRTTDGSVWYVFSILGTPADFEMTAVSERASGLCDGVDIPIALVDQ